MVAYVEGGDSEGLEQDLGRTATSLAPGPGGQSAGFTARAPGAPGQGSEACPSPALRAPAALGTDSQSANTLGHPVPSDEGSEVRAHGCLAPTAAPAAPEAPWSALPSLDTPSLLPRGGGDGAAVPGHRDSPGGLDARPWCRRGVSQKHGPGAHWEPGQEWPGETTLVFLHGHLMAAGHRRQKAGGQVALRLGTGGCLLGPAPVRGGELHPRAALLCSEEFEGPVLSRPPAESLGWMKGTPSPPLCQAGPQQACVRGQGL